MSKIDREVLDVTWLLLYGFNKFITGRSEIQVYHDVVVLLVGS